MKRILIIDALNLFIKNFIVNPTLSNNGIPVGGVVGFLQSLQKLCREINPGAIFCVWDGGGGSLKRKRQNKDYKNGRKVARLNRVYKLMEDAENIENELWQQSRLLNYLNNLPIVQFMYDSVEADDIIAILAHHPAYQNDQKVIVSSDKDFIQLCDSKTILYRPTQSEILTTKTVIEKFNIHPNNFCLARSLSGDKSDNLKGVEGAGLPTIAKRFPFLVEEKSYTINDVVQHAQKQIEENKKAPLIYAKVASSSDVIKENYSLMQLAAPTVSYDVKEKLNYVLESFEPTLNRTYFIQYSVTDGFAEINFEPLFRQMSKIVAQYQDQKK